LLNVLLRRDPSAIRYLKPWLRSLRRNVDPLSLELPWLTFGAIEWLDDNIKATWRVLELGSGGSTAYFAKRVASLVSFEHDRDWSQRVKAQIGPCDTHDYRIFPATEFLNQLDLLTKHSFDLVLVDGGKDRAGAVLAARRLVKPGGHLILDNADAPGLEEELEELDGLTRQDFFGIAPWNLHRGRFYLHQTSVWTLS